MLTQKFSRLHNWSNSSVLTALLSEDNRVDAPRGAWNLIHFGHYTCSHFEMLTPKRLAKVHQI